MPAAALLRVRADDTLWAALRVMAFTDEHIRAAVKTGQYTDPAAEKLLSDVLIKRRDKIARVYLAKVNPLVKFSLDGIGCVDVRESRRAGAARRRAQGWLPGGVVPFRQRDGDEHSRSAPPPSRATNACRRPPACRKATGVYVKASVSAVDGAAPLVGDAGRRLLQACRRCSGSWWALIACRIAAAPPAKK